MKKLLIALALFSTPALANTVTCQSAEMYKGTGDGVTFVKAMVQNPLKETTTINLTSTAITMQVGNSDLLVFWKDYNTFRANDGELLVDASKQEYTMLTALPTTDGNYEQVKIVYKCK